MSEAGLRQVVDGQHGWCGCGGLLLVALKRGLHDAFLQRHGVGSRLRWAQQEDCQRQGSASAAVVQQADSNGGPAPAVAAVAVSGATAARAASVAACPPPWPVPNLPERSSASGTHDGAELEATEGRQAAARTLLSRWLSQQAQGAQKARWPNAEKPLRSWPTTASCADPMPSAAAPFADTCVNWLPLSAQSAAGSASTCCRCCCSQAM